MPFAFLTALLFLLLALPSSSQAQSDAVFEVRRGGAMSLDEYNNVPKGLMLPPELAAEANKPIETAPVETAEKTEGAEEEAPKEPVENAEQKTPVPDETQTGGLLGYDAILVKYREGGFTEIVPSLESLVTSKHSGAEELLGIMYRMGQGVEKNPSKALELLTQAAEQGRPLAAHHLGNAYYAGDLAGVDKIRALMWLHIAIVYYPDGPERVQAQKDRDSLFVQITREERDEAMSLAREILTARGEAHLLDLK